ncbi:MAG: efflux RND transporter periplasmic adaptor subunit [Thermodesulfobacteriota bacterium]
MRCVQRVAMSLAVALLVWGLGIEVGAQSTEAQRGVKTSTVANELDNLDAALKSTQPDGVNAVIYPYQSATIGSEVRGILNAVNFKEGQAVQSGDILAEVSKPRYEAIVGEFKGNYHAIKESLDRAREEVKVYEQTYEHRANTYQQLLKAKYEVKVLEGKLEEAEHKLKQADLNLQACVLRAPFAGTIAVLYRDPYETVDYLEKVAELIDTRKVYARVNWPESRLSEVAIGKKARFKYRDRLYEGVIDKMSSLIDPGSKSKRIHILIDNPAGTLQVGMSGSVTLDNTRKTSMHSLE